MAAKKTEREGILHKAGKRLLEWDKKVKVLEAQAKKIGGSVKEEALARAKTHIHKLKKKQTELKSKIGEYKRRGETAWSLVGRDLTALANDTSRGLHKMWGDAKKAMQTPSRK